MVSRLNKVLQSIRDVTLAVISIVLMSTSYGKWVIKPVHFVFFGLAAGFSSYLSLILF